MSDALSHLDSAGIDLANPNFVSCKLPQTSQEVILLIIIIIAIVDITTVIL